MTLQEYFDTPETVLPQELIYGTMRVAESPTSTHQSVVASLFLALHGHVSRGGLGSVWLAPLDVVLDADRALVVQPDLFVVLNGSAAIVHDKVWGAPDLVIEVLSPRPRIGDLAERLTWFADHGVRECWLVDQLTHRMEILEFQTGQIVGRRHLDPNDSLVSVVLPDFTPALVSIFGY